MQAEVTLDQGYLPAWIGGGRIICCNSQAPTIAGGSSQAPSFGDQGGSPAGHPNPQTGGFLALLSLDAAPQHPTL